LDLQRLPGKSRKPIRRREVVDYLYDYEEEIPLEHLDQTLAFLKGD
jgi:hypothetical protein